MWVHGLQGSLHGWPTPWLLAQTEEIRSVYGGQEEEREKGGLDRQSSAVPGAHLFPPRPLAYSYHPVVTEVTGPSNGLTD